MRIGRTGLIRIVRCCGLTMPVLQSRCSHTAVQSIPRPRCRHTREKLPVGENCRRRRYAAVERHSDRGQQLGGRRGPLRLPHSQRRRSLCRHVVIMLG